MGVYGARALLKQHPTGMETVSAGWISKHCQIVSWYYAVDGVIGEVGYVGLTDYRVESISLLITLCLHMYTIVLLSIIPLPLYICIPYLHYVYIVLLQEGMFSMLFSTHPF